MNRIEIEQDLILYQFPPVGENARGMNIYLLLDGEGRISLEEAAAGWARLFRGGKRHIYVKE